MSHHASTGSQLLRIGDIARATGKTVRAIHLYEELGLLKPASRSSGGFRLYEPSAVERVRWIDLLHGLGFSLQEMREVLKAWWGAGLGPEAMDQLRTLFKRKLEDTREAVRRHRQFEVELQEGLAYLETCRGCATPQAPPRGCVTCTQDHGMEQEPALLAGLKSLPGPARRPARSGFVPVEDVE
ncbi:MAG: MerR family transcriptional regulator [Candidatus Eisenbacteria bacterium]|nr:MerR family transcriptional regulator [Candidatus Eisenbacteria bacterium]